jgi:phosphoribosyl 1,2-cyclic phosphodiesterase
MKDRFTVLASGSSGNAALLEANGFGLLIDCGLGPRMLAARLREIGVTWGAVHAVILTHTHGDHWKDYTLADLRSRNIPFYAHVEQLAELGFLALSLEPLRRSGLARSYSSERALELAPGLVVRPVEVSHDAEPTFAFRIDQSDSDGLAWSVGYASDLGCGSQELIEEFAGVDVLALEFNHDVKLERRSRRPQMLIDRVLGDTGHLSNEQAGELAAAIAARSGDGFPSHLVQLHLSRECNNAELALRAGRTALAGLNPLIEIVTARQDRAVKGIALGRRADSANRRAPRKLPVGAASVLSCQRALPGFE